MKNLNLKPTGEAAAILFGFFAVLTAASCAMQAGTADAVRVVIYEWGAFPLLCAIVAASSPAKAAFCRCTAFAAAQFSFHLCIRFIPNRIGMSF